MDVFFWCCAIACLGSLGIIGVELCRETWVGRFHPQEKNP